MLQLFGRGVEEFREFFAHRFALAPDALNGFRFDTSNSLRVDTRLGPQYRENAERLAEQVLASPELLAGLLPCEPTADSCASEFLTTFGERAFRRPLKEEELQAFLALFTQAGALLDSGDAFRDGVRLTLQAFLQSPQFLYRTEESLEVLSDWEMASRLSFFLYDSMPDEELFELARSAQLRTTEQIADAARRMMTQPQVLEKFVAFHEQSWDFGRFARISPDRSTFDNIPDDLVGRVRRAATLFVKDVLARGGGLEEMLLAPYAFIDNGLAPLYGLETTGDDTPRRVDLSGTGRLGLLMQVGFLASNAYAASTDPIHRGLFVIRELLCREVPAPPPGASTTPLPETDEPLDTTRQQIGVLTGQGVCPVCHTQINPPGFTFEGFDALGQARQTDNGFPVDTASYIRLDDPIVSFTGPQELLGLLARSEEAHRCYSRRFLEYSLGRPLAVDDLALLDSLAGQSLPLADLVATLVTSSQFSSLATSTPSEAL